MSALAVPTRGVSLDNFHELRIIEREREDYRYFTWSGGNTPYFTIK